MATHSRPTWYKPDAGLAARIVLTMFLLGLVYVVFAVIMRYALGAPWILLAIVAATSALDRLDRELTEALEANDDDARFHEALVRLIAYVRGAGQIVPVDEIVPSDMMVPAADMTLAETRAALASGVAAG